MIVIVLYNTITRVNMVFYKNKYRNTKIICKQLTHTQSNNLHK
jgi:hypothetical protein